MPRLRTFLRRTLPSASQKVNERGVIAHLFMLLLLGVGLLVGLYLVQHKTNLLPKAASSPINTPTTSFTLSPDASTINVGGDKLGVKIVVRSDISSTNLFAAKINFNKDLLAVTGIDYSNSLVANWIEQYYDNTSGVISLVGGIPTPGFKTNTNSAGAPMAVIYFKALKSGNAIISFADTSAIYTNADNLNILTVKDPLTVVVVSGGSTPPTPSCSLKQLTDAFGTKTGDPKYNQNCDLNSDGQIDIVDFSLLVAARGKSCPVSSLNLAGLQAAFGSRQGDSNYNACYDLNGDGQIDIVDFSKLSQILSKPSPVPAPATIVVSPQTIASNGVITVTWAGVPNPNLKDVIQFVTNNQTQIVGNAVWINSCGVVAGFAPATGTPKSSGSCIIDLSKAGIPSGVTTLNALLYSGVTPGQIVALSNTFTLTSVSSSPAPSASPIPGSGDANNDGKVDFIDLSILLTDYNKTQGFRKGIDMNGDGVINAFDFSLMRNLLIQKGLIKG